MYVRRSEEAQDVFGTYLERLRNLRVYFVSCVQEGRALIEETLHENKKWRNQNEVADMKCCFNDRSIKSFIAN